MSNVIEPVVSKGKYDKISYQHISRVLCATDLSTRSEGAVQRAVRLANRTGAMLLLLHVVDEEQRSRTITEREHLARSALRAHQLTSDAEIAVPIGKPHRTIAQTATDWDADLIVLGRSRKRSRDSFLGTTAERVIRTAHRTVLVVNNKPKSAYENVLLASDLSHASTGMIRMANQLGLLDGARTSIIHVYEHGADSIRQASWLTEFLWRSPQQSSFDDLFAQLDTAGLDAARFDLILETGRPSDAISKVVEHVKPQLLVLGASRYPALQCLLRTSVTNELLRKSDCDVLIASAAAVAHVCEDHPGSAANHHFDIPPAAWPPF